MAIDRNNRYTFTPSDAGNVAELKLWCEQQLQQISDSLNLSQEHALLKAYYKEPQKYLEREIFIAPSEAEGGTWDLPADNVYVYFNGSFRPLISPPATPAQNFVLETSTQSNLNVVSNTNTLLPLENAREGGTDALSPNGGYKVQSDGTYTFFAQISFDLSSTGAQNLDFDLIIAKNETQILEITRETIRHQRWHTQQCFTQVDVLEGDVINMACIHNSTKPFNMASRVQEFFGFRIK